MHPDNNWYGNRKILLEYCNLKNQPVFASLLHGWLFYDFIKNNKKKMFGNLLCWNVKQCIRYKKKNKNTIAIGAPFLYFFLSKKKTLKKKHEKGTLCFPAHSITNFKQYFDHEKFIKKIEKKFVKPFTVCLYYEDYKNNIIKNFYKKKKWKIVSAGNRSSNEHIKKIFFLLTRHKNIVLPCISTTFFYSLFLKKKTFLLYKNFQKNILYLTNLSEYQKKTESYFYKNYPEIFTSKEINKNIGFKLASDELGLKHLKKKNELIKLLGLNSFFKKLLANFFAFLFDMYYGKNLRKGIDTRKFLQ